MGGRDWEDQPRGKPEVMERRQQWRPRALASAESLAGALAGRRRPILDRACRAAAWYERLFRRVRPFGGWMPLMFEFGAADGERHPGGAQAARQATRPAGRAAVRVPDEPGPQTGFRSEPPAAQTTGPFAAARPNRSLRVRPPLRLAVLRAVREDSSTAGTAANAMAAGFAPALISHAARSRREVRGGFPVGAPSIPSPVVAVAPSSEPAGLAASWPAQTAPANTFQPAGPMSRASIPSAAGIPYTGSMDAPALHSRSVVEQLVEQMAVARAVPGLELRLHRRSDPAAAEGDTQSAAPLPSAADAPPPARSTAPAPAPIDLNSIVDQVQRTLIRRQQRARERKGLY